MNHQNILELFDLYLDFVVAIAAFAAVLQPLLVSVALRAAVQLLSKVRLLVLGEHGRRALDDVLELLDRVRLGEVVPEADVAEEGGEGPRRLEGGLGLLDLARAEDEDEEADLLGVLAEVAAVLQARDAHVPLLQRRDRDRPAEPSLWVNDIKSDNLRIVTALPTIRRLGRRNESRMSTRPVPNPNQFPGKQ